jgi:hypothetical protein
MKTRRSLELSPESWRAIEQAARKYAALSNRKEPSWRVLIRKIAEGKILLDAVLDAPNNGVRETKDLPATPLANTPKHVG